MRIVRVWIWLFNLDGRFFFNMFGIVEIVIGWLDLVVFVLNDVIVDMGSRWVVFIDKGEGRFELCDVEVGVCVV